jgi:hypothetical protein
MMPVLIMLPIAILMIASMWRIFTKAGKPGWASIVPIYNLIVMLEIARKPVWWIVLFFIPFVSFVMAIVVLASVANNFGKGGGFVVGMLFLPMIFYPILAFGDAQYIQPGPPQYGIPPARAYY